MSQNFQQQNYQQQNYQQQNYQQQNYQQQNYQQQNYQQQNYQQQSSQHSGVFQSMLVEENEQVRDVLSNSVMQSLASGVGLGSNVCFYTDKRLYAKVRTFSLRGGYMVRDIIISLKDIAGTELRHENPIGYLITCFLLFFSGLIFIPATEGISAVLFTLLAALYLALFCLRKGMYLRVSIPGGVHDFSVKMYSYQAVDGFHKRLNRAVVHYRR